ncbi:MAG TPA: hypothetical protein IAA04_02385 [Candidatus Lachnoclostridium pullistercoris]|uniref:Flavodoxin-like domain-containing protein n=1 Tax=Candidatus Lachnoclostridium pullistercoris TaxID=2838632 RepID=A0A9D2PCT9_9FIRM|nr:hypothetical protein [Candidatus Lachnoclostridium pullistercoris]
MKPEIGIIPDPLQGHVLLKKEKEETVLKKAFSIFLAVAMVFSLTACGQSSGREASSLSESESAAADSEQAVLSGETQEEQQDSAEKAGSGNILVAYFSWADNAILAEDVDAVTSPSVIPPGNVQQLAGWVQEETGGDLFSIRVTDPYPSDWDECLDRANQERGDDARPELAENVADMEQYDTIFLGYPKMVVWRPDASPFLSGSERPVRKGGLFVLFPWHRRTCQQCGIDH